MADPFVIITLISMALGVTDEALKTWNKNKLKPIIKEITDYVNKNQRFLNDLQEAYAEENSNRLNALFASSPIGTAYKHLKNELSNAKTVYEDKKAKVTKQIDNATQLLDKANSGIYSVGNSMLIDSVDNLLKSGDIKDEASKLTNIDLINGGTNNAQK